MLLRPEAVTHHTPLTTRTNQRSSTLHVLRSQARTLHSAQVHAVDSHRGEGTWSATRTTTSVIRARATHPRAQASAARAEPARKRAHRAPPAPAGSGGPRAPTTGR